MPDHRLEAPPDEPLFPEDDPLTISVPGVDGKVRKFVCLDRANPPLESDVDPSSQPVSYMVELLARQVIEDDRDEFEELLVEALRANRILYSELLATARWLGEQRRDAEAGALSRSVKRPTKARPRSTR